MDKPVDCLKCKYYAVTWEPKQPKACKLFGFKSAQMPSTVVYSSTGSACMGFEAKKKPR
ncbi:MAG: uracil-DNA glycosylase [Oscillospiraceae bacterium]|nr:uracil-DNA glycosylase [Oscillospiraceae bacterium]